MPKWTEEQQEIIRAFKAGEKCKENKFVLCTECNIVIDTEKNPIDTTCCPACGHDSLVQACPLDTYPCNHDNTASIEFCPICGANICPICGCHDVVAVSRVTGYYADVQGWNMGKQQELKDRTRTDF